MQTHKADNNKYIKERRDIRLPGITRIKNAFAAVVHTNKSKRRERVDSLENKYIIIEFKY